MSSSERAKAPERPRDDVVEFRVTASDAGRRLDRYLTEHIPGLGRATARRLCEDGSVLVDGRARAKSLSLQMGQSITVRLGAMGRALRAPDLELRVALETSQLVIVDKPAGLPCGAVFGKERHTLAGALLARYPEMAFVGRSDSEPGLVNRIDNQTSGLVLAAREPQAFAALVRALSAHQLEKHYLALVAPKVLPAEGRVHGALAPDPRNRRRVLLRDDGHEGLTEFWVRDRTPGADLVLVRVQAAYRHQIRCHLAHVGAPLLGDALYGGPPHPLLGARHALHATYIGGQAAGIAPFAATSPLPEDLCAVLGRPPAADLSVPARLRNKRIS